jgi:hypothetical protein
MYINSKQRDEIERLLSNWGKYLNSIPPDSDDLKLHKWLGMNTVIVKKDNFNNKLRLVSNKLRKILDEAVL